MDTKTNRIVIRGGSYAGHDEVERLVSDAGITTEENLADLTDLCNTLGWLVRDEEEDHVDLFVQKKNGLSFLCANVYSVYLALNNLTQTLEPFRDVLYAAESMSCRAVDRDTFVIQLRFLI